MKKYEVVIWSTVSQKMVDALMSEHFLSVKIGLEKDNPVDDQAVAILVSLKSANAKDVMLKIGYVRRKAKDERLLNLLSSSEDLISAYLMKHNNWYYINVFDTEDLADDAEDLVTDEVPF